MFYTNCSFIGKCFITFSLGKYEYFSSDFMSSLKCILNVRESVKNESQSSSGKFMSMNVASVYT